MGDQFLSGTSERLESTQVNSCSLQWDFACSGRGKHEYKMKQYNVLAKPVLFKAKASYQGILDVTPGSVGVQLDKQTDLN